MRNGRWIADKSLRGRTAVSADVPKPPLSLFSVIFLGNLRRGSRARRSLARRSEPSTAGSVSLQSTVQGKGGRPGIPGLGFLRRRHPLYMLLYGCRRSADLEWFSGFVHG